MCASILSDEKRQRSARRVLVVTWVALLLNFFYCLSAADCGCEERVEKKYARRRGREGVQ
jgi:hypothetical protein